MICNDMICFVPRFSDSARAPLLHTTATRFTLFCQDIATATMRIA
jgi:hypothetical protein